MMVTAIVSAIHAGVRLLGRHGGLVEVRMLKTAKGTVSGYFDNAEALVRAITPWDGTTSIYVTPNPVNPALLARSTNRVREHASVTTADRDIVRRRWFLIDCDAVRPAGISATDAEVAAALRTRNEIVTFLGELDFPPPVIAMSGNGGHAIYPVDLANDDGTTRLFERALNALAARFSDHAVKVDEAVFNAARIWKLYGTIAVKGDATTDRPHRRAVLERVPETLTDVPHERLAQLAAMVPAPRSSRVTLASGNGRAPVDILDEFKARDWYLTPLHDGKHAVTCPWASDHSGDSGVTETVVFEPRELGGPWGFDCKHDHCVNRTIRDVYRRVAPSEGATTVEAASERSPAVLDGAPPVEAPLRLAPEALSGLAGRIVGAIDPHSEADPIATLIHLLVSVGNLVGADVYARVQEDEHPPRLNVVLVGPTSKGRKGTAWSTPKSMIKEIDEAYARACIRSGLSSGEGLIYHTRDPREEQQPLKERGRVIGYQRVVVDEGVADKRLLVIEPEFASVLKRMNGETNSLSAIIRDAWDHGDLSTLTKNSPMRATRANVGIIAHVTQDELLVQLTEVERANGFANRFLFVLVRRSKVLPEGGAVPRGVIAPLIDELRRVVDEARGGPRVIERDAEARAIWAERYPKLSEGEPGLLGAIISRAEAQVLRLSVLYAILDRSRVIRPEHLYAALAVWQCAEDSARRIFGGRLGLVLADTILEALKARGEMTDTDIYRLFRGHKRSIEIGVALDQLKALGRVDSRQKETGGRPVTVWVARA